MKKRLLPITICGGLITLLFLVSVQAVFAQCFAIGDGAGLIVSFNPDPNATPLETTLEFPYDDEDDNVDDVETMAFYPGADGVIGGGDDTYYFMNVDDIYIFDPNTDPNTVTNTGNTVDNFVLDGPLNDVTVNDVDGMSYAYPMSLTGLDPSVATACAAAGGCFWASAREGGADFIFLMDLEGNIIEDAFGTGVDYIVPNDGASPPNFYACCPGTGDLDDIAIDPTTGELWAVINDGSDGDNQYLAQLDPVTGEVLQTLQYFFDTNGNGTQDPGEDALDDVEGLSFTQMGQLVLSTGANTTNDNQIYLVDPSDGSITFLGDLNSSGTGSGIDDVEAVACGGVTTSVPIELSFFFATPLENVVQLVWITASEVDNDYFEVERSMDGIKFEPIGKVTGSGTTIDNQSYKFIDPAVKAGVTYYYRLKQVDFDNSFEYTKIVTATLAGKKEVNIYPNPVKSTLYIDVEEDVESILILNQLGKEVKYIRSENKAVDVSDLNAGIYHIYITTVNNASNRSFVKID